MAYIGQEPGLGQAERFIFTASGNETSVTTADDGRVIGYTVGQVSVYLNGVKLVVGTDCVATNGSTIASLSALSANDVIEVIALSAFSPADTVSAASGGTFSGAVTLPSPVINTGVSGTAVLDSDTMSGASATTISSSESIKAYVDANSTADQAFTTARVGTATTAAQGVGTGNTPEFAGVKITASGGINFSAYATSGNPSSNLLDDYEEGTWSPTPKGSSGTTGSWAHTMTGHYTKIGRTVFVTAYGYISNKGSFTGDFECKNLPFTVGVQASNSAIGLFPSTSVDAAMRTAHMPQGDTGFIFKKGSRLDVNVPYSEIVTGYYLTLSATYQVD